VMAAAGVREWRRVVVVVSGFAALFAVVAVRAGQLTVIDGQRLAGRAHDQQNGQLDLLPLRGPIVDRGGEPLALTVGAESLYLHPKVLRTDPDKIAPLAAALGLRVEEVERKAHAEAAFVWLKRLANPREVAAVMAVGARGVGGLREYRRVYPRGSLAVHVLGFAGIDAQGLEGVERFYDPFIRPPSRVLEMALDAHGRGMLTTGIELTGVPVGARVELTIDAPLQTVVERELARGVAAAKALAGTAVVLDPWTGAVLAIANVPRFDPNNIGASSPAVFRNRAITDMHEPGSTFKAVLAAAALDLGVASPGDKVYCEAGRYHVGRRVIRDHHPRRWLTFAEVVQYSSNIGAAKVAESLGRDRLYSYVNAFGFGEKTDIDLPGEVAGRVLPAERWGPLELATVSFGQGVAVTSLQMARAFAAIANGGLLLRPYVMRRIVAPDGKVVAEQTRQVARRVVRPETAAQVRAMLRLVVEGEGGTGRLAQLPGVAVAGKTGTAQKVDPRTGTYSATARVASFVGFVPADEPRVVILVMIDEPRTSPYGGVVAAPVFREVAAAVLARVGMGTGKQGQVQEVRGRSGSGGADGFLDIVPRVGQARPEVRA
jgi:cell division protein FtsI (penicillin-binding protein 3)